MSTSYSYETIAELKSFEIDLDGERLFPEYQRTSQDRLFCMIVCGGVRLSSLILLGLTALLAANQDYVGAINLGMFAILLLFASVIGLREFNGIPRRLVLDNDSLHYIDTWAGEDRKFARKDCANVCSGEDCTCRFGSIYIVNKSNHVDLLADRLPNEAIPAISEAVNQHLQKHTM